MTHVYKFEHMITIYFLYLMYQRRSLKCAVCKCHSASFIFGRSQGFIIYMEFKCDRIKMVTLEVLR